MDRRRASLTARLLLPTAFLVAGGRQVPSVPQIRAADSAPQVTWRLDVTLTIGSTAEGADFGRIAALQVDKAGTIYVFEQTEHQLRVFGQDGKLRRTYGRRGAGPGEFQGVIGMAVSPGGGLWIVDGVNARYTVFDGPTPTIMRRPITLFKLPWLGGFSGNDFYDGFVHAGSDVEFLLGLRPDGAPRDTTSVRLPVVDLPRRGSMSFPLPFAASALRSIDARGFVWVGRSDEYRVNKVTFAGDTVAVVSREVTRGPLTSTQQDSLERYIATLKAQVGVNVSDAMRPRQLPVLHWFFADDEGRLWVKVFEAGRRPRLDVFDANARYLASIDLPFEITEVVPLVRGGNFFAVVEAADGTPQIIRARIRRS